MGSEPAAPTTSRSAATTCSPCSPSTARIRRRSRTRSRPRARTPAGPARSSRPSCGRPSTPRTRGCRAASPTDKAHEFFHWVRERSALAVGHRRLRDEPRRGLAVLHARARHRAGRHDRAPARHPVARPRRAARAGPRSCARCGAYEAYLRTYRGVPIRRARPSSCCWTGCSRARSSSRVIRAEECLRAIDPRAGPRRRDRPRRRRLLGQIRTELEYRPISEILGDLPGTWTRAEGHLVRRAEAIRQRYFPTQRRAELDRGGLVSRCGSCTARASHYERRRRRRRTTRRGCCRSSSGEQFVLSSALDIRPVRRSTSYLDYWGTRVVGVRGAHAARDAVGHGDEPRRGAPAARIARAEPRLGRAAPRAARSTETRRAVHADRPRPARRPRSPSSPARSPREHEHRRATPRSRSAVAIGDRDGVHARRHRRALHGRRGVGRAQGRLPGHRAHRARRPARGRHPGALRLGLPAPRRRAPASARRSPASRTPGSSGSRGSGTATTRRTASRSATATCSSAAAATTATSRRCAASTPGPSASALFVSVEITRVA